MLEKILDKCVKKPASAAAGAASIIGGGLAFSQLPNYLDKYTSIIGGAKTALESEYNKLLEGAKQFYDGNLSAYIGHFTNSNDPVFAADGANKLDLANTYEKLANAYNSIMNSNMLEKPINFLKHIDLEYAAIAVQKFKFAVLITPEAMCYAAAGAAVGYAAKKGLFAGAKYAGKKLIDGIQNKYLSRA